MTDKRTYYVYNQGNNDFKLCDTRLDAFSVPPLIKDITSNGGGSAKHEFSLVNPRISVLENNNLVEIH